MTKLEYQATVIETRSEEQLTIKLNYKDKDQTGLLLTGLYLKPQLNTRKILKEFEYLREIYLKYNKPTIIIGGDFNLTPDELRNIISHFLEELSMDIFHSDVPTRNDNTLDYFIASSALKDSHKKPLVHKRIGESDHNSVY